jgi:CRISPR system Cascade subunit CasE
MTGLVMARARLRRDVPAVSFAVLLVPSDPDQQAGASHRLVWSLYADGPDRPRDFLWRQTGAGEFLTLGPRIPVDSHGLFELEHKPFAPELRNGDRLGFNLRANATVARPAARGQRGVRHDVVMNALHALPPGERAAQREQLRCQALSRWLTGQGETHGFELVPDTLRVAAYQQLRLPRAAGKPIQLGVADLTGELVVRDPAVFVAAVAVGFGKARAFGCGLMLLRRLS